jgi:hypothetical protein
MAPPVPEGENARDRGIALARDVAKTAGTPPGQTPTREDWAGYYRMRVESAERNLSPREAMTVVAGLERYRQAGMNAAVALATTALAANDLPGAARAMELADRYLPDGFRTRFEASNGAIVMTRTPEGGGEPQRVSMTPELAQAFAMRTMNPQWALQHELSTRQQNAREENDRETRALRRAELYAKAGADILFVESPESVAEMQQIGRSFDLPLVANMVEGGRTPVLSFEELQAIGYGLAIFPATAFLAAAKAYEHVYTALKQTRSSTSVHDALYDFPAFSKLMGFDWVTAFDQAHAKPDSKA